MPDVLDGLARHLADRDVSAYDPTGAKYPNDAATAATVLVAVPDTPFRVLVLSLYPGPEGAGEDTRNGWSEPRLQVRVRSRRKDPRDALDLDRAAHAVLHGLGPLVLPDGTDLQDCYSLQSAPMPMGQDASGRWEFSRNYQLTINT